VDAVVDELPSFVEPLQCLEDGLRLHRHCLANLSER
jgi:hypothetical protein